jgi:hypothetical protein
MNLQSLDASHCSEISDEGIKHLNLHRLYASNNEKISDWRSEVLNI